MVVQAIADNTTRMELFEDHMRQRQRREAEARRAEKNRRQAAFRELLENSNITVSSQWRKVQPVSG